MVKITGINRKTDRLKHKMTTSSFLSMTRARVVKHQQTDISCGGHELESNSCYTPVCLAVTWVHDLHSRESASEIIWPLSAR